MKNKYLFSFLLIFIVFSLSACNSAITTSPIEDNEFNMIFKTINLEEKTSDFIIEGYPNEEEQKQIEEVVLNSLNKQEIDEEIKVNLYSNYQDVKDNEQPFYGTMIYKDKKIIENNLIIPSEDDYLDYASN